jgi:hypothetical protein
MLADVQFPVAFQNFQNFIYSCSTCRPNSYRTVFDPVVLMTSYTPVIFQSIFESLSGVQTQEVVFKNFMVMKSIQIPWNSFNTQWNIFKQATHTHTKYSWNLIHLYKWCSVNLKWKAGFKIHLLNIDPSWFKDESILDVHRSVHRNINPIEETKKMQPCSRIYYSSVS